jgi:hypothetical protein
MDISKGYFGFNHPEFSQMFLSVADFCSESRAESVHIAHGATIALHCQLTTYSQIGWFFEEFFFKVDSLLVLLGRYVFEFFVDNSGDLEHVAGSFTVTGCDYRSVNINEASGLVE